MYLTSGQRWLYSNGKKMSKSKQPFSYGVPSGPMIIALRTSTRASSTRKKTDECHATGRLVVRIANSLAIASDRLGAFYFAVTKVRDIWSCGNILRRTLSSIPAIRVLYACL